MIEVRGDMWELEADARCITTNGTINRRGECVMGRGVAEQAKRRYPGLAMRVAAHILNEGNVVAWFPDLELFTVPVKPEWWDMADLDLIAASVDRLCYMVEHLDLKRVLLPRPGCGYGHLTWEQVGPVITPTIDVMDDPTRIRVIEKG